MRIFISGRQWFLSCYDLFGFVYFKFCSFYVVGKIAFKKSKVFKCGPAVYREDYLGAIRRLTRQRDPDALIRMLQRAHEFSENIYDDDMNAMQAYLESCHAFDEPENGKLKIIARK